MPPPKPTRSDEELRERLELESRLYQQTQRLRILQEQWKQEARAKRENWPRMERRYHQRRQP